MKRENFEDVLACLTGIEKLHVRAGCIRRIFRNEKAREKKMLSPSQREQLYLLYIKTRLAIIEQRRKASAA